MYTQPEWLVNKTDMATMGSINMKMTQELANARLPQMRCLGGLDAVIYFDFMISLSTGDIDFQDNILRFPLLQYASKQVRHW